MSKEFIEDKLIQADATDLLERKLEWMAVITSARLETVSCLN